MMKYILGHLINKCECTFLYRLVILEDHFREKLRNLKTVRKYLKKWINMDKETIMKANAKNNEMNQTTDEHHGMLTYVGTTTGRQWKNAEIGWTWLDT